MNEKIKKALTVLLLGFFAAAAFIYVMANGFALPAHPSHVEKREPKEVEWSFNGVLGTVDKQAAQRGYQVYKEVCASCHSMKLVSFRDLSGIGITDAEIKEIAKEYKYPEVDDSGEPIEREGKANDKFHSPFANPQAAAASNGGAIPPDLSLMVKAREDGPNYIYSLLTGYGEQPPAGKDIPEGKYYNPYFPGGVISMPHPLTDDQITYQDGTKATTAQMAHDVVNFLQYTAEPEMQMRKHMGIKVILFLCVFTIFFYIAKVRVWADVKKK